MIYEGSRYQTAKAGCMWPQNMLHHQDIITLKLACSYLKDQIVASIVIAFSGISEVFSGKYRFLSFVNSIYQLKTNNDTPSGVRQSVQKDARILRQHLVPSFTVILHSYDNI